MSAGLIATARRALPLMTPEQRAEAEQLLAQLGERTANESDGTLADFTAQAAATFERAMQPACGAIAAALQDGDLAALKGLRAMLPALLGGVIDQPVLSDLLAAQLGRAVLEGFSTEAQRSGA